MTKLLNTVIVVLALTLVAVILYPQIQEGRPRTVRIACDNSASSLLFLIGIDDSLFVKNRIIPELVFYSDPDQALERLFAGDIDIGVFPYAAIFRRMIEHQDTLKVFISMDFRQSLPVDAIVVPAGSRIKSLSDLKKKKLGYPPQLRGCIPPFVKNTNLTDSEMLVVEVPFSALTERLRAGEIDAAWLLEPLICVLDSSEFRVIQPGALPQYVSAPFPGAAVGFAPDYLNLSKVFLSRLRISTDEALALAETRKDHAREVLARYFPDCAEACSTCRLPGLQKLVEINKPAVSALADRLTAVGVFDEKIDTRDIFVEPIKMTR